MKKIYCKNCKYYLLDVGWYHREEECKHLSNIKEKDDYDVRYKTYIEDPFKLNKSNNCKNYKKKWYKLWL